MAESRLALKITDLTGAIGHFLGYGRGVDNSETTWTTQQQNDIDVLLKSGLSQVYVPPLINGQAYSWSFLKPWMTITLTIGNDYAELPDDFGGFSSRLFVTSDSPRRPWSIPITTPEKVELEHVRTPRSSGAPVIAAEFQKKETTIDRGQRSQLYVFPTPDAAYTLRAEYQYLPDVLTGAYPYPPGGSQHGELFKASCLAAAELQLDDARGPRWVFFMERLGAAIAIDRKRKGDVLGYNADMSDVSGSGRNRSGRHGYGDNVTLGGRDPDSN